MWGFAFAQIIIVLRYCVAFFLRVIFASTFHFVSLFVKTNYWKSYSATTAWLIFDLLLQLHDFMLEGQYEHQNFIDWFILGSKDLHNTYTKKYNVFIEKYSVIIGIWIIN